MVFPKPKPRYLMTTVSLVLLAAYARFWWAARDRILQGQSDFISYYTAARMMRDGVGSSLYDLNLQSLYQDHILKSIQSPFRFQDGLLAYNHPPFEISWYLPLAYLNYLPAYLVWVLLSFSCFVAGAWLLVRCPGEPWTASLSPMLGCLAFFPVLVALIQGQDSGTLFLFWVLAYRKIKQGREVWAGFWLSLMLQKFPVVIPTLLLVSLKKRWRILAGLLVGSTLLLLLSVAWVGFAGLESYSRLVVEMSGWIESKGIYPSQMHNLRGQFHMLCYHTSPLLAKGLTAIASLAMLGLLWKAWRGKWDAKDSRFDLKFSLLVTISVLVSPHLNFHDVAVLLVPGLLVYRTYRSQSWNPVSVYRLKVLVLVLGFPVMLATLPVSAEIPVQLSVCGMLILVFALDDVLRATS